MTERTKVSEADLRTLRILAGAMIAGAVVFAIVGVVVVREGMGDPRPTGQTVSLILALLGLGQIIPQWFMMQRLTSGSQPEGADPHSLENLVGRYRAALVIRCALIEGAIFMNVVAYLIEHNWWSLAIAGGLVFVMLIMFPTRAKVDHWIETQQMMDGSTS